MATIHKAKTKSRGLATPIPPIREDSVSVRKIPNGYLISCSGTDAKGNWRSEESYSPTNPVQSIDKLPKWSK